MRDKNDDDDDDDDEAAMDAQWTHVLHEPIFSRRQAPLYHFFSFSSVHCLARFSPDRPLHGTYTTSDS
jgi:hypothetical protein